MKKIVAPLALVIVYGLLVMFSVPSGHVFGSNIDWLCQHVALAETIRDACLAQHTLLPDWLELGGGSNGYQFAYYGYLRPDILLGCLLPKVPMSSILIGYALAVGLFSALLVYRWLLLEVKRQDAAWLAAVLFMTAGCMFHLHRQIMFVNYFPFLLLALIALKKERYHWLPLWLFGVCVSSFYYAPAVFVVVGWYWYRLKGKNFWRGWLAVSLTATGMALLLLLPSALVLLEHRSSQSGGVSLIDLLTPHWNLSGLLFDKYGIGLSALALYVIIIGLREKHLRVDAIFIFLLCVLPLSSYLLNGTLYARAKILMPFLSLVILLVAKFLAGLLAQCEEKTWRQRSVMPLWPFVAIVPVLWGWMGHTRMAWMMVDVGLLLLLALAMRFWRLPRFLVMVLLLIAPIGLFFTNAATEDWVSREELAAMTEGVEVSAENDTAFNTQYHFDSAYHSLEKANLQNGIVPRSSMYSSATNQAYASFYYDILLAPIQINNRVALLTANDPFLLNVLGTRYLETEENQVPQGYDVIMKSGHAVLAENRNVLPRAYVTDDVVAQDWFETLSPYEKLDVLARKTVVDDDTAPSDLQAGMPAFIPEWSLRKALPEGLTIEKTDAGWLIDAKQACSIEVDIKNPQPGKILLCQFNVNNQTAHSVISDMNGMRNMLSGAKAPYPNKNTCFHYKFSTTDPDGVQSLSIDFSPGRYILDDIQWHSYDAANFNQKRFTTLQVASGKGILSGQINCRENSVLATTIPMQKGMKIFVDGQETPPVRVNTAFMGCALSAGKHNICVAFSPPGKVLGIAFSIFSALGYIIYLIVRRFLIKQHRI